MAPKFPNQQLRSVSLETFFPGRFATTTAWPTVQELLSDSLPNLYVPGDRPDQAPALRPYHLRNVEGTRSLALAINQATYVALEYPGFEAFVGEAVPLLERVHREVGVTKLTRVAYRYENAIGVSRSADGALGLANILKLDLPAWLGADGFRGLHLEWRRIWAHGEVYGSVLQEGEPGHDVLRISIAADVRDADRLAEAAALAHERAYDTFDGMITDTFRSFLEWKPEGGRG